MKFNLEGLGVSPWNPKKLSLEEAAPRNIKAQWEEQHKIKKGKKTYFCCVEDILGLFRGAWPVDTDMIILIQDHVASREAGSFSSKVLFEFCNYMSILFIGEPCVTLGEKVFKGLETSTATRCIVWRLTHPVQL